ncbi:hypothetical protein I309_05621 [Cryptococcus deuterogattii LA55]|nr:hypothetical protein I309_05621 [Cryptococcus deuterogattii LA55]KIR31188.1 hypothetical protein I352_06468 [Cryptococcus deuterogattii MMRL2647]KIR69845.1 hypothetical protein I310_06410 [Cryptococcus deuterogattii CA1014]KIR89747.1 hypothetical protein I304_06466 [Cryptococcus deuterogattii CBS 10090]KIR96180.1 hypothetical protein L804_06516 [Cryptococcus deuterogattii 2001/935-1]
MGFFSFFSKSSPPDYETLLSRLATDIAEAKTNLSEIRLRERRIALLVYLYGFAGWALWVEKHLRKLLTEQRTQLEEIKKATNYDSTRKLIERYDNSTSNHGPNVGGGPKTPQKPEQGTPDSSPKVIGPGGTPRAPGHLIGAGGTPGPLRLETPLPVPAGISPDQAAALQMQMGVIQPILPTPEKRWYDRLADSILGDDPSQATQNKYALVCEKCFRHNGLVGGKYEWERMNCNYLNPPPISRVSSSSSAPQLITPSHPSKSQSSSQITPSHVLRSSASPTAPRARRPPGGEKGTPRTSKLAQEVFNASDDEAEEEMDVDEQ